MYKTPEKLQKKKNTRINDYNKCIEDQHTKSIIFLCTINEHIETKIKYIYSYKIPFTIPPKKMKYLDIHLIKPVQSVC